MTQVRSFGRRLVRDGLSYVNKSRGIKPNETFTIEKAPRTGLGVTADGSIVSVAVDGVEVLGIK
jgi:hypothetical protein